MADGTTPGVPAIPDLSYGIPSQDTLNYLQRNVNRFKDQAAHGGFGIDEVGGAVHLKACDDVLAGLDRCMHRAGRLEQAPRLGGTYGGVTVAKVFQDAVTDESGLVPRLRQLQQTMQAYRQGIQLAMKNYREIEARHAAAFKKAGHK